MNHVILVGRLATDPVLEETSTGKKRTCVNLAIPRSYRNADGVYETDFIRIVLWNGMASNTKEYCHQGDMIGIKGRLQTRVVETPEGTKRKKTEIIAEKVTFLTSNPQRRKSESSVEELSEDQEEKVEE